MYFRKLSIWLLCLVCLTVAPLRAAESKADEAAAKKKFQEFIDKLKWTKGPATTDLGRMAQIKVPEGYMLADAKSTQKLLEAMGNPINESELGLLAPTNLDWFVVFEFSDVGYVKDDDKDKLDADKILKSIKEGTEAANEERKKMGVSPLKIVGWDTPPKYNDKTHNLEWAVRGESDGEAVLNYNTRILGRKGVMEVNLVIDPEKLHATMPIYQDILAGYTYKQGETYAEYKSGDKVAQYGLAALVVGGAAVGAAKLGLFAWLAVILKKAWKLVVVGFAAVVGAIKKLFGRGEKTSTE